MIQLAEATQIALNEVQKGTMTIDQANVYIVQLMGARLVVGKIPASVRKALNAAVKAGEIGHIKKDGLKPEAYHHKNGRARALDLIDRHFYQSVEGIKKVVGFNASLHQ
jgi:hypothetical protein